MEIKITYSKSYYKNYFRKQSFLALCQAQRGHSFVHRFTRSVPTKLPSFSQLRLLLVSEISFPPTRLPPGYLPSIPSPFFQAVRILSIRSHTDTHLSPPFPAPPPLPAAAAAAKSLQSCPTLCDPIDGSPTGSTVPGILQASILEWVAISFSKA